MVKGHGNYNSEVGNQNYMLDKETMVQFFIDPEDLGDTTDEKVQKDK